MQQLIKLSNDWLGLYPNSDHPCDDERFFKVIKYAYVNGFLDLLPTIELAVLVKNNQPDWTTNQIDEFVEKWETILEKCIHLLKSMQKNNLIPYIHNNKTNTSNKTSVSV